MAKTTDRPLETLSAQLASALVSLLTDFQQKINAAVAAGEITVAVGEELTQMIIEASTLPKAVAQAADAHHSKVVRNTEARRAGGRERWARSKEDEEVEKRRTATMRLVAAAKAVRNVHPYDRSEHHTNWLAEQLAPKFSKTTPQTIRKKLNALKIR